MTFVTYSLDGKKPERNRRRYMWIRNAPYERWIENQISETTVWHTECINNKTHCALYITCERCKFRPRADFQISAVSNILDALTR